MAISPVSSVSVRNNGITFQAREKKADSSELRYPNSASKMVTVPVAVLMALATTSLNAKEPSTRDFDRNIDQTELLAYAAPSEATQPSRSASAAHPTNTNILDNDVIHKKMTFYTDGKLYTMYLTDLKSTQNIRKNFVNNIYIIPKDFRAVRNPETGYEYNHPPVFKKLIVHVGDDPSKAYGGALVEETICDQNGKNRKVIVKEIKLSDDVTNQLFDIYAGDTNLKLIDRLKNAFEETSDMNLKKPKIIKEFVD